MPSQYFVQPDPKPFPVLIIEDDPLVRTFHVALVSASGYPARSVENGEAALDALKEGPIPSLIILDLEMPGMNGRSFRRCQLADDRLASIPVVVCTGYEAPIHDPLFLGCHFLEKPTTVRAVRELLRTILEAPAPTPAR